MLSSRFWSKCTCPFKCSGIEILLSFILFYFGQGHIQKDFFSSLQVFRFWSQTFIYLKLAFQVSIGREALLKGLGKKVEFGQQCGWVTGLCGTKVQSNRQALLASFHPPHFPRGVIRRLYDFFFLFFLLFQQLLLQGHVLRMHRSPVQTLPRRLIRRKSMHWWVLRKKALDLTTGQYCPDYSAQLTAALPGSTRSAKNGGRRRQPCGLYYRFFFFLPEVFSRSRIENVIHDDNSVWNDYIFKAVVSKHWFAVDPNIRVHIFTMRPR